MREALRAMSDDAPFIVTDLTNIRYLTGFSGSNAVLVLGATPSGDLLGTDGRYVDQAAAECPDLPSVIDRATLDAVLARLPPGPVLIEGSLAVSDVTRVREVVGEPAIAPAVIETFRSVKDAGELACLAEAGEITARAFESLVGEIQVGDRERALARRLEQLFGEFGADDRAFVSIVASGEHSAVPHHRSADTPLRAGDLLVIDAGACVAGYHADMTRTFVVGRPPAAWQVTLHDAVLVAQQTAVAGCRPGVLAVDVDALARDVLSARSLGERFTHGLGHGVGLQIHESPAINARATGSIEANMAFTVEPGAYLPGVGGVRIEDTLVVTDAGPRVLTTGSRELRVVGV